VDAVTTWEWHVEFECCFNFRDLGGYPATDGREVRRGALYRSDSLHRLSHSDLRALAALHIRTVIDLRTSAEIAADGRIAEHHERVVEHVPFDDTMLDYLGPRADNYFSFAQIRRAEIATAVRLIAYGNGPMVFHCMAGKDRTGVLAALVLATLGVPDTTIAQDYELTERSLATATAWANANDSQWAAWLAAAPPGILNAPAVAIEAFLMKLRAAHGTIEDYLAAIGAEEEAVETLRARYLM
jgi:protein tyrosine/serine phosphatase